MSVEGKWEKSLDLPQGSIFKKVGKSSNINAELAALLVCPK